MNILDNLSKSEQSLIQELSKVNIEKNYKNIIKNTENFFQSYISKCKTPIGNIIVRILIVRLIQRADTLGDPNKFLINNRKDALTTFNDFYDFYEYILNIIDFIIENEDNAILDLYNDKKIGEKEFKESLKISKVTKLKFHKNKKELDKILSDIAEAIRKMKEGDNLSNQEKR